MSPSQVGDAQRESNPQAMAHFAPLLRVRAPARRAPARRLTRTSQRGVRRVTALALVLVLIGAGLSRLRDSELVAVRDVTVTGVSSSEEGKVRQALRRAALDMTTLHVRTEDLRAAVAPYASVASLEADADFPNGLRIEVVERLPAALLVVGGQQIAVSSSGLLLRGVRAPGHTPVVSMERLPVGSRLKDGRVRSAVTVLAGAPPELRGRIKRAGMGPRGLELELRDGPELIFGSPSRLKAKWIAAARVLADSSSQGATYLDLRLPEWTAAGGLGPIGPATDAGPTGDAQAPAVTPAAPAPNPQP